MKMRNYLIAILTFRTSQPVPRHFLHRPFNLLVLILIIAGFARGERLPVKTYTTADGLLRDTASCIVQDSRGFLWFCTSDGLSRFDGYAFTNYTTDDGLPHRIVNAFLETRSRTYWVATNGGLSRFNPSGARGLVDQIRNSQFENRNSPMFVTFAPQENESSKAINVLFEDAEGKLWCGTDDGLFLFEEENGKGSFHRVDLPKARPSIGVAISSIIQDRRGNVWIGTDLGQGLNRVRPDGRIEHYTTRQEGNENKSVKTLIATREDQIWVGMSDGGLCSLVSEPKQQNSIFSRCYSKRDGLPSNWIGSLYQTADGKLWIGTTDGTATPDFASEPTRQFRVFKEAEGLCEKEVGEFLEDRDGNLWVSTNCGIKKITRSGFVRFTQADGLASLFVNGIFSSRTGELFAITKQAIEASNNTNSVVHSINRFDKGRFTFVTPRLPPGVGTSWGSGQIVVQDKAGDWWLPGDKQAVYSFSRTDVFSQLARAKPQAIRIPGKEVFRIYEDSKGDIWISTTEGGTPFRWDRATETLRNYKAEIAGKGIATCFAEDSAGNLWMGFDYGEARLAHYRDGHFDVISNEDTKATGGFTSLLFDHDGRLWFTSKLHGLGRIDNPNANRLQIVWYDRKKGLATDGTTSLVEDRFGHIYVGHGRGVDRIDPSTGQIKHYTTADGLPQGAIQFAARDAEGALWVGSYGGGAARLVPEPDKPRQLPNILLTGLRVNGIAQTVSALGEATLSQLNLDSNQTQVSIDFIGLGASLGEDLKYEYKLAGANDEWIPTAQRTIDFANLSPGTYRFQVRAISFDNLVSPTPATISFTIAAPIWQRWWFVTLVALLVGLSVYTVYRYRLARVVELERVRTRIAADLHDDIGASLSRMAIMSEVVKREVAGSKSVPMVAEIADSARELVGSMRDIVWAIDPRRDDLSNVVFRIREFASGVLEANGIKWHFRTPSELSKIKLGPDERRHVFLFFKEAINNIARHANANEVWLDIQIAHNQLLGEVRDDGRGFTPLTKEDLSTNGRGGHGLENMKRRVTQLRGNLVVNSSPGKGTQLKLTIPLKKG